MSKKEFLKEDVLKFLGGTSSILNALMEEIEKRDFIADNSLLMKNVGFKPRVSLEDGLLKNINLIYNKLKK